MVKSYKTTLYLVLAVAIAIFFYFFYFEAKPVVNEQAGIALASYTNANGQKWAIQAAGGDNFTVSSAETYPRFVLGSVDPVKVSIGDTQKMQIVVRDNVPVKRVWAEIENDKSTEVVELALGASSTVSYDSIQNQKYLVASDNTLTINDGANKNSAAANLIQSLFQKASAENAMDYSYSGSWVVHDTRTITYHTTFFMEDTQGRIRKLVLAWSDPCYFSSGVLQNNCTLTSEVDGVDGVSMSFGASATNIHLTVNSTLAFNQGQSISLTSGKSITIDSGTQIKKANLYYTDADSDGYPASTVKNITGGVRVVTAGTSPTLDCDEYNSNVHPGQAAWFTAAIVDSGGTSAKNGTYDYNCDGLTGPGGGGTVSYSYAQYTSEYGQTTAGSVKSACQYSVPNCNLNTTTNPAVGWSADWPLQSTIPNCGASSQYVTTVSGCSTWIGNQTGCNSAGVTTLTQGCH